jgi:hypothetical protein
MLSGRISSPADTRTSDAHASTLAATMSKIARDMANLPGDEHDEMR